MVIQRWQSLLLLIAVVCMGCFSFLSLGQIQLPDYTLNFTALGFSYEGEAVNGALSGYAYNTWILFILSILSALMALIAIFTFKNLKLQKRVILIDILLIAVTIGLAAYYGYNGFDNGSISWSSLVCAPFISLVAAVMAYNRICADDRLLRSADRLR